MNPNRTIRCGVCAPLAFKRADRGAHTEPLWSMALRGTPHRGLLYARNLQRLPTGIERCASCAAKAGERLRQKEQDAGRPVPGVPVEARRAIAVRRAQERAAQRRAAYRKPAKPNRHDPRRTRSRLA